MIQISKIIRFEAAHKLPLHDGKCARLHGHSWVAEVTVSGKMPQESGPKSGMLIDYGELSDILKPLVDILDHRYLNEDLPPIHSQTDIHCKAMAAPTSENIAIYIFQWVNHRLNNTVKSNHYVWLSKVTVWETCTSKCEVT